jgi:hypothetical protein
MIWWLRVRAVPGSVGVIALIWLSELLLGSRRVPLPSLFGPSGSTAWALLAPAVVPVVLIASLQRGDDRLLQSSSRQIRWLDAGCAAAVVVTVCIAFLLSGAGLTGHGGAAARNILGYSGIAFVARVRLRSSAGVAAVGYAVCAPLLSGAGSPLGEAVTWCLQPGDNAVSWLVATAVFVLGIALLGRLSFRLRDGAQAQPVRSGSRIDPAH